MRLIYRLDTVDEIVLADAYRQVQSTPLDLRSDQDVTIIDVGAHIGSFAVAVAAAMPRASVHAVEPAQANFDLLCMNIAANSLHNVTPHRLALSSRNNEISLHHHNESWAHSVNPALVPESRSSERVPGSTLTGFMADNSLTAVDFMKMNAEGSEYPVLLGTSHAVLCRVRAMGVEFHPVPDNDGDHIRQRLTQCGFCAELVHSAEEKGKGWVRASLSGSDGGGERDGRWLQQ